MNHNLKLSIFGCVSIIGANSAQKAFYQVKGAEAPAREGKIQIRSARDGLSGYVAPSLINQTILKREKLTDICSKYRTPWFYVTRWFPMLYGQLIPTVWNAGVNFDYERVYLHHEQEAGNIVLDLAYSQQEIAENEPEKVLVLLHGVAGSGRSNYMQELAGACSNSGINVVVFNHYAPSSEDANCRLMNMCYNDHTDEVLAYTRNKFDKDGAPCEVYLGGFSLGGNHMLRYAGQAGKERQQGKQSAADNSDCVKAVIAICTPFDVTKTATKLQKTHFGLWDAVIAQAQHTAFSQKRFANQDDLISPAVVAAAPAWSNLKFDDKVRRVIWGYDTVQKLYDHSSCIHVLADIQKPFMILMARDDPVSLDEDVPTDLILQNPNSLLIQSDHGIHCDFFTEEPQDSDRSVRRLYPDIVISYIDEVSKCNKSIK